MRASLMATVSKAGSGGGYDFFRHVLKSPKYVVAPMVDQSELAFRLLCRRYGAQLCYTPMLHSKQFAESASYRDKNFSTCDTDRPLVAQFCANDPHTLLQAAKFVEHRCDAVDINLGCPQMIARRGHYGAYLMEDWPLIFQLVRQLHESLAVPVFCKIRMFPDADKTVEYAKMLESAGCQLLAVHGRTRDQRKSFNSDGSFVSADWAVIKRVKEAVSIPVFANGNIQHFDDIEQCMSYTGADGVMSALALLRNPALFSGRPVSDFDLVYEYLQLASEHDTNLGWIRGHLGKMLEPYFDDYLDVLLPLFQDACCSVEQATAVVRQLQAVVATGRGRVRALKPPLVEATTLTDADACLDFGSLDIFATSG